MARVYTIANQKGGIGKTTTAQAFTFGLARKGYKVLAIDTDQQCNFTSQLIPELNMNATLFDIITHEKENRKNIRDVIYKSVLGNEKVDMIPATRMLSNFEGQGHELGDEYVIQKALKSVQDEYDFVIIDTPPSVGKMLVASLFASDGLIIPTSPDIFSVEGFDFLCETVQTVQEYSEKDLNITGILLVKYKDGISVNKFIDEKMQDRTNERGLYLFKTKVHESVIIKEAQVYHEDMFVYDPKLQNRAVADYAAAVDEFLTMEGYDGK